MAKSTDLDKKSSHPFRCVVISGVTVDHANGINESWYAIDHANLKIQNTRIVKCGGAKVKLRPKSYKKHLKYCRGITQFLFNN